MNKFVIKLITAGSFYNISFFDFKIFTKDK